MNKTNHNLLYTSVVHTGLKAWNTRLAYRISGISAAQKPAVERINNTSVHLQNTILTILTVLLLLTILLILLLLFTNRVQAR